MRPTPDGETTAPTGVSPVESWRGELIVGSGWARFFGRAGAAAPIACRSAQVITAICSWTPIGTGRMPALPMAGAIVRSGESYHIAPERPQVMVMFADARLPGGGWLETHAKGSLLRLSSNRAAQWRRLMFALDRESDLRGLLEASFPDRLDADRAMHPAGPAATSAAIVTWQRVARTVDAYRDGAALPQAARQAGFPSVGHCTRAFRLLFGLSPTALLGAVHADRGVVPSS